MNFSRHARIAGFFLAAGCLLSLSVAAACSIWYTRVRILEVETRWDVKTGDWGWDPVTRKEFRPDPDHAARRVRLLPYLELGNLPPTDLRDESCSEGLFVHQSFGREYEVLQVTRWYVTRGNTWTCTGIEGAASLHVGWPLACLWTEGPLRPNPFDVLDLPGVIAVPNWLRPTQRGQFGAAIPTRIIPLGLALTSAFYGALLACAVALPRSLRTALRLRRNHCPSCNYNRHGLASGAACPECGMVGS